MEVKNIYFINGINILKGGSGKIAINYWLKSLNEKFDKTNLINTVPNFKFFNNFLLILYYFPFCLLRIKNIAVLEFFYKVSFFSILKILLLKINHKNEQLIFSHHSIFYLSLFYKKKYVNLLCQDLLLFKSKTLGNNRIEEFLIKKIESFFLNHANKILVHSYKEKKYLNLKGYKNVYLISCYEFNEWQSSNIDNKIDFLKIAVCSDWRRYENTSGIKTLFENSKKNDFTDSISLNFYGYDSDKVTKNLSNQFQVKNIGEYHDLNDVNESVCLVPIYKGAGIKLKVLEAIDYNKIVIGTSNAFIGLPSSLYKNIGFKIKNLNEIEKLDTNKFRYQKNDFVKVYEKKFLKITEII